jgi:transposase
MTTKTKSSRVRQRHSPQHMTESLTLAEKIGVPTAAKQWGLHESQLYSWRSKARLSQDRNAAEERLLV